MNRKELFNRLNYKTVAEVQAIWDALGETPWNDGDMLDETTTMDDWAQEVKSWLNMAIWQEGVRCEAWNVVGWYNSISADNLNSTNLNDGALFFDKFKADTYGETNMRKYWLTPVSGALLSECLDRDTVNSCGSCSKLFNQIDLSSCMKCGKFTCNECVSDEPLTKGMCAQCTDEVEKDTPGALYIDHDPFCDSPNENDGWKLYSFNRNHNSYKSPDSFFGTDEDDDTGKAMKARLESGTAFVLSYYEHGGCRWFLKGTGYESGVQCRWDTTQVAGILLWDLDIEELFKEYDKRRASAECFLKEYTDWCNGNCYSVRIVDMQGNDMDGCSGIIGTEYLYEFLQEEHPEALKASERGGDCIDLLDYMPELPEPKAEE